MLALQVNLVELPLVVVLVELSLLVVLVELLLPQQVPVRDQKNLREVHLCHLGLVESLEVIRSRKPLCQGRIFRA